MGPESQAAHERMLRGEAVIVDIEILSRLEEGPEYADLASIPNPARVGTRDIFLAFYASRCTDPRAIAARRAAGGSTGD